jgi:hypothetical protein
MMNRITVEVEGRKCRQGALKNLKETVANLNKWIAAAENYAENMDATQVERNAVTIMMRARELADVIRTTNEALAEIDRAEAEEIKKAFLATGGKVFSSGKCLKVESTNGTNASVVFDPTRTYDMRFQISRPGYGTASMHLSEALQTYQRFVAEEIHPMGLNGDWRQWTPVTE